MPAGRRLPGPVGAAPAAPDSGASPGSAQGRGGPWLNKM